MPSVSDTSTAPATQPTNASTISRMAGGSGFRSAKSETATRPPGFSTRAISRQTCALSGERLMTQLEMMASTELSGTAAGGARTATASGGFLRDLGIAFAHHFAHGVVLFVSQDGAHKISSTFFAGGR